MRSCSSSVSTAAAASSTRAPDAAFGERSARRTRSAERPRPTGGRGPSSPAFRIKRSAGYGHHQPTDSEECHDHHGVTDNCRQADAERHREDRRDRQAGRTRGHREGRPDVPAATTDGRPRPGRRAVLRVRAEGSGRQPRTRDQLGRRSELTLGCRPGAGREGRPAGDRTDREGGRASGRQDWVSHPRAGRQGRPRPRRTRRGGPGKPPTAKPTVTATSTTSV